MNAYTTFPVFRIKIGKLFSLLRKYLLTRLNFLFSANFTRFLFAHRIYTRMYCALQFTAYIELYRRKKKKKNILRLDTKIVKSKSRGNSPECENSRRTFEKRNFSNKQFTSNRLFTLRRDMKSLIWKRNLHLFTYKHENVSKWYFSPKFSFLST